MKNGIAMISNFSMPVKSFSATDWIGTLVMKNRYVSTVRPSEIEIGMPVSIRPKRSAKMIHALATSTPASLSSTGIAINTGGISAGQRGFPGTGPAGSAVLIRVARRRRSWRAILDRRRLEIGRGKTAGGGLADAFD